MENYRRTVDYSNLVLSESNGHWSASWDRGGRHFNTDQLYGCSQKRSYNKLKSLLGSEQGIPLPSEIVVKTSAKVEYGLTRKVYVIDEKLMGRDDVGSNGLPKAVPFRSNRGYGDQR